MNVEEKKKFLENNYYFFKDFMNDIDINQIDFEAEETIEKKFSQVIRYLKKSSEVNNIYLQF